MRNSNFNIKVLHNKKSNIDVFFVTSLAPVFLFHLIGHTKRCMQKKNCDMTTLEKQCTVPVTLTFDI